VEKFVGMVVRIDGAQVTVRDPGGGEWRCVLRGRLRKELTGSTSPLAVGDRVDVMPAREGDGVVDKLHPRRSRLARRAVLGHDAAHRGTSRTRPPREHVLAANLDLAVVVVAAPPRQTVIDRHLALIRRGDCQALLCVNKIDLIPSGSVEGVIASYRHSGIPVLLTSVVTGEGVADLRESLAGKLVALVGPSGGGKSSLLNAMDPSLGLRTGDLTSRGRGSHTTNSSSTYAVADALVVDTPGLREIGFLENEGLDATEDLFPEITALAGGCWFRDCAHTHEPRCAVKAALEAGFLEPEVYRRYARLARSG